MATKQHAVPPPDRTLEVQRAAEAATSGREDAWQRAIEYGIDVSLLEENLRLTPGERLAQLVAMQRLFEAIAADVAMATLE